MNDTAVRRIQSWRLWRWSISKGERMLTSNRVEVTRIEKTKKDCVMIKGVINTLQLNM